MKKFLLSIYSKYFVRFHRTQAWLNSLDKISNISGNFNIKSKKKLRILVGPSFSLWEQSSAFDRIISTALEHRGCEITPMYCDSIQETECNCVGGDWVDNKFKINCKKCKLYSEKMWKPYKDTIIKLSNFVDLKKSRNEINELLSDLDLNSLVTFKNDSINYGFLAKDILVNNHLVSSLNLVPNSTFLMREHIKNLFILNKSYSEVIKKFKPDRVISNDSSYGMWKLIEIICKKNSIPFYSHWPITKNRIVIARNDAALNFKFKNSWREFLKKDLTKEDENKIDLWLKGSRGTYASDQSNFKKNYKFDNTIKKIDLNKPTLLLAVNVSWDIAALNKQVVYEDMNEWIIETIKWFSSNLNYQLIIKPHPWENLAGLPKTNETTESVIFSKVEKLPQNVHLLKNNNSGFRVSSSWNAVNYNR